MYFIEIKCIQTEHLNNSIFRIQCVGFGVPTILLIKKLCAPPPPLIPVHWLGKGCVPCTDAEVFISHGCWEASHPPILPSPRAPLPAPRSPVRWESLQLTLQPAADTVSSTMVPSATASRTAAPSQPRFRIRGRSLFPARTHTRTHARTHAHTHTHTSTCSSCRFDDVAFVSSSQEG